MSNPWRKWIVVLFLLALAVLYIQGALTNASLVNTDMHRTDQGSFMTLTKQIHAANGAFTGYRNQMPAYSYIQLLSYRDGITDDLFFERGKKLNIVLSFIFLIAIGFVFFRRFSSHMSMNALGVIAFSVFIFKAGYFHCSLMYYFLHFMSFLLILKMLTAPTHKTGLMTGLTMGLAYLTKASFLPCALLALAFFALKAIYAFTRPKARSEFLSYLIAGICFFVTIFPYIQESHEKYGRYFYNVNTSFYMWYETRPQVFAESSTRSHGDRKGWPDLPIEVIPGPLKYLEEHSLTGVFERIVQGSVRMLKHCAGSFGFFKYLIFYMVSALVSVIFLVIIQRSKDLRSPPKAYAIPAFFVLSYFAVYFLSFSFYMATGPIIRHVLSVFLLITCYIPICCVNQSAPKIV